MGARVRLAVGRTSQGLRASTFTLKSAAVPALAAALVLALCVVGPGCNSPGLSDPAAIVRRAITSQGRLQSVHMNMDGSIELRGSPGARTTTLYKVEGVFGQPDRSKVTVRSDSGETEVIAIGDKAYVRKSPGTGWSRKKVSSYYTGGTSPSDVTNYLKYTKDLQLVDRDDGTYHLTFDVDMGRYSKVAHVPGIDVSVFRGTESNMEVWVRKDSFDVSRAKMSFGGNLAKIGAGNIAVSVDVEFTDFNKPVNIEAPI